MPRLGGVGVEPVGPLLFDGTTAVQEWVQEGAVRGTSVRRFADGWLTYAADYFDTAVPPATATSFQGVGS